MEMIQSATVETPKARRVVLIRVGSDVRRRKSGAEHALYAQGHADLHVPLILIQLRTTQPSGTQLTAAVMQPQDRTAALIH